MGWPALTPLCGFNYTRPRWFTCYLTDLNDSSLNVRFSQWVTFLNSLEAQLFEWWTQADGWVRLTCECRFMFKPRGILMYIHTNRGTYTQWLWLRVQDIMKSKHNTGFQNVLFSEAYVISQCCSFPQMPFVTFFFWQSLCQSDRAE